MICEVDGQSIAEPVLRFQHARSLARQGSAQVAFRFSTLVGKAARRRAGSASFQHTHGQGKGCVY